MLHAEYIMKNAGLEEIEIKIKIDSYNVNKLRNADSITSLPGCLKDLRSILLKMKEYKIQPAGEYFKNPKIC